jgi:predicted nucleic acid-binding Zn ribbon protein
VHFKGSGFYTTDYGRGSRKAAGAKEGDGGTTTSGDSGSGSKESGSGEKKAAAAD